MHVNGRTQANASGPPAAGACDIYVYLLVLVIMLVVARCAANASTNRGYATGDCWIP